MNPDGTYSIALTKEEIIELRSHFSIYEDLSKLPPDPQCEGPFHFEKVLHGLLLKLPRLTK